MHLLIGLLVVAVVVFFLYRALRAPAPRPVSGSIARSSRGFAFLSNGGIFFREAEVVAAPA